jgi:hypothetical protein
MIDSSPTDRQTAKEIMIAYITALGVSAEYLFRKKDHPSVSNKSFEDAWETILKTISDHS